MWGCRVWWCAFVLCPSELKCSFLAGELEADAKAILPSSKDKAASLGGPVSPETHANCELDASAEWVEVIRSWPQYAKKSPKRLVELVCAGIPQVLRCVVWPLLAQHWCDPESDTWDLAKFVHGPELNCPSHVDLLEVGKAKLYRILSLSSTTFNDLLVGLITSLTDLI